MQATVLALISVVLHWLVATAKDITNRNWNGILTRVIALGGGIGAVALYAHQSIPLLQHALSLNSLNGGAQGALGLGVAATGGTLADLLRTFNRSDGSVAPTLVPPGLSLSFSQAVPAPAAPAPVQAVDASGNPTA